MRLRPAATVAKALLKKAETTEAARRRRAAAKAIKALSVPEPGPSSRLSVGQLLAMDRERRASVPVTLPPITMLESPVADEDLDLPHDPVAQERAERFLAAAYAYQRRQAEKAEAAARVVHVEVEDESLHLSHLVDKQIGDELQRLVDRPPVRWRNPHTLSS
jgi:hypothetical protein